MNEVINTLKNRTSLRKYKNEDISKEHLNEILECAMRAPTAGNMMLYSIIVVKDKDKKKKLSVTCDNQPFIKNAPVILIFLADFQKWFDYYDYSNVKEFCKENNLQFRTPDESDFILASEDAMVAAQNAAIAAESLKIGSCYVGDIIENYEIHKEMFDLPKWVAPIGMLCLGYYEDDFEKKISKRFPKECVIFEEKYKKLDEDDFEKMFNNEYYKVNPANIYNATNFGQLMYARKTGSDFSKEMSRSAKIILRRWCENDK